MKTEDGKELGSDTNCIRAKGQEAEQLHQLARIFRHHVKYMIVILEDGKHVHFNADMIKLTGMAFLHLARLGDIPWK